MGIRAVRLACLLAFAAAAFAAQAQTQLLKCRDADGRVTYSDLECDSAVDVRELSVSRYGSAVALPRGGAARAKPAPAPARNAHGADGARGASPQAALARATTPAGAAAERPVRPDGESAENEKLRGIRDDYRRDVNRVRTEAAKASILTGR